MKPLSLFGLFVALVVALALLGALPALPADGALWAAQAPEPGEAVPAVAPQPPGPGKAVSEALPQAPEPGEPGPESLQASQMSGGMPGWPLPEKPIPHHEVGHLSSAGSYTTDVTRVDETGALQTVTISGVDALAADGVEPLAGNHGLVDFDQILVGSSNAGLKTRTYTSTLELIGSLDLPDYRSSALTAGDLNADGRDEQIFAWMDAATKKVWLAIGEIGGVAGRTSSAPAVVVPAPGVMVVVARGYDDALWAARYEGGAWGTWSNAGGGTLASAPAMTSAGDGQFDVYVIGTDNQVHRNHWNVSWWPEWDEIGGWPYTLPARMPGDPELPAPAVVAQGTAIDLFRLAPDNTVHWNHSGDDGATWSGWRKTGEMISAGLAAVAAGGGQVQVYGRGVDEALWTTICSSTACGAWQRLELDGLPDGVTMASASAVARDAGQARLYVQGSDDRPYWVDCAGGTCGSSWTPGSGKLASGIAAAWFEGTYRLLAQRDDGQLQESVDGNNWTALPQGLSPCCTVYETPLEGQIAQSDPFRDTTVDVEVGYFLGDGRRQIALAYRKGATQTGVALFKVAGGFLPQLVTSGVLDNAVTASIATGDFFGRDGIDDVALAYTLDHSGGVKFGVKIVTLASGAAPAVRLSHEENDTEGCSSSMFRSTGTAGVTGGDYDGDGQEELATIFVFDCAAAERSCDTYDYHTRMRVYDVLGKAGSQTLQYYYTESYWGEEATRDVNRLTVALAIASGDVNGDGRDEIVRTWPIEFGDTYHVCYTGYMEENDRFYWQLQVVQLSKNDTVTANGWDTSPADHQIDDGDRTVTRINQFYNGERSYRDRLGVGDLDRDMVDEIVWHVGTDGDRVLRLHKYDGSGYPQVRSLVLDNTNYPHLALGSFSGQRLRVGQPTYRLQNRVDSLVAVINMPPKHRDYVKVCDPTCRYELIEVLTEACWSDPSPRCTHAKHASESGTQSSTETKSQRDWSAGGGLNSKVGYGGFFVDLSLKYSYGDNFTTASGDIDASSFTQVALAAANDQVINFGTPYRIWEYPIYAADSEEPADYLAVEFPVPDGTGKTRGADVTQADWPQEPWYRAGHQIYNVWSYDARTEDVKFPDYNSETEFLDLDYSTSNVAFSLSQKHTGEYITTTNKTHAFSAEFGGGYETPKWSEVAGWKGSVRAYVNGSYSTGDMETEKQVVSDATDISGWIGDMSDRPFNIRVLGYYASGKYMVLDYQTAMPAASWNSIYSSPDPAFILPWAGFAYGSQPQPSTPGLERFSPEVWVAPAVASWGQTVTISATVRNFSNFSAANVRVRFCLDDPGCKSGDASFLGEEGIGVLDRLTTGPVTVSVTWQAAGIGERKIYAIIDPDNAIDPEVHDEDDLINNNIAFNTVRIGRQTFVDQGQGARVPYHALSYDQASGLTIAAYIPPGNMSEVVHFALQDPTLKVDVQATGRPFELVPYKGEQFRSDPEYGFDLRPAPASPSAPPAPPAVISLSQPGANVAGLKLYRAKESRALTWEEATCPGYEVRRFTGQNLVLAPVCKSGIFVWSAAAPVSRLSKGGMYVPLVLLGVH